MDFSFIQNVPFNEYTQVAQQGQYLTSHFLADFRQCPLLYWQKLNGAAVIDDTTAFQIGRAAHSLVLGGKEAFDAEYLVSSGPINPKTGEPYGKQTKAFKDWAAEQEKVIITESEFDFLQQLQNSVWNHAKAMELLNGCYREGTVRSEYLGEPVQIRMDAFNPSNLTITDLKTCDNLDYFKNDCFKYGYAEQMAFYQEVFSLASGGVRPSVWLIAVEKRLPYRCGVWQISDALLEQAKANNERGIEELKACREQNVWPTRYEDVRTLENPE